MLIFAAPLKAILAVAYHPDGRTLTGDSNGDILLWSFPAPTYTIVQAVSAAHAGGVGLLNFTADGFISAGVHDNSVMLYGWDLKVGSGQQRVFGIEKRWVIFCWIAGAFLGDP